MTVSRFAPSPTGYLHIGHAWSALFSAAHGTMILRIEDIDTTRCKAEFETGLYDDLRWLGLTWPEPVRRQSDHFADYRAALARLDDMGLLYPCFCTRKDIQDEIARADSAPHDIATGPEGHLYPGTCRHLSADDRARKMDLGQSYALRLNMDAALATLTAPLTWHDRYRGPQTATPDILGDVVLARKDTPASYHLCVTLDDHIQNVDIVTRGEDLFYASHLHRLLQNLLDLNVPEWAHHPLLLDPDGKRFAKRNNAVTLHHMRTVEGKNRTDILTLVRDSLPIDGPWREHLPT
ncbi:tRNA glutamyl-Q(34) synthetase GluQRS [Micavibrio aeruginosavorus]|uniref:Glutamyl-Q-tRNA synthetase n=1 Tax=Micavibrio aeruginosavorus EPB TaxID=349215 RepID=M4VGN7_9BACT|nr:tRNA glutamyl-Q(34) synthetase GluQRS [Micavibrio aeruginosavorus]AGH98378.1 glutamyl-Q-tRNA synthetase [Micavibrio aeruginosavorus EPB]